jgi:hypothetical protein
VAVLRRQPASRRYFVQYLGMPCGKNFDLPWDFAGGEKTCRNNAIPG